MVSTGRRRAAASWSMMVQAPLWEMRQGNGWAAVAARPGSGQGVHVSDIDFLAQ